MDEREIMQQNIPGPGQKNKENILPVAIALASAIGLTIIALMCGIAWFLIRMLPGQGCEDYTIRQELFYEMYTEEYPYWETVTVEYPQIEGIDPAVQESLNTLLYDTAMDRVNYWHLHPSKEVRAYQDEDYQIFASDVSCDATFHSQYLLSINYQELYCAGNPVYLTKYTQRTLNLDLTTGETYELSDIFRIDKDFIRLWQRKADPSYGLSASDDESTRILLSWFLNEDEELQEFYEFRPFFYVTENNDFVIGISLDPTIEQIMFSGPQENSTFRAFINVRDLEPWRTDSKFWQQYEKSESTGTVIPCEERETNLWLGKEASIWMYYEEY